jgi:hypothetical protein
MPSQNRPASPNRAPDPATNYERAKPENEAGMGDLDSPIDQSIPGEHAAPGNHAVPHAQNPGRQTNAHDDIAAGGGSPNPISRPLPGNDPNHSMHEEEPTDADQAPLDIHDPQHQRHPRREGKGGTK